MRFLQKFSLGSINAARIYPEILGRSDQEIWLGFLRKFQLGILQELLVDYQEQLLEKFQQKILERCLQNSRRNICKNLLIVFREIPKGILKEISAGIAKKCLLESLRKS